MEAYLGQPSVHDLESVYHYRAIERSTRFIGVTGFGAREIIAVPGLNAVRDLAQALECRHVLFEAIYTTIHDVLVVCDTEKDHKARSGEVGVHPGYLRSGMTVLDLTAAVG